ncbi:hypothetical protein HYV64_02955 [Candidatus Shapirobacteria bacterium]|nr:hypothetical protein [Candidatus Shapirobacteria bacterium]
MLKNIHLVGIVILAGLFIFLRFYSLNNSFFFLNDMGRDMLVLQKWHDTGKPPLLGPQTSVMPFNQSAVYFYLLYPGFLLSGGHPISSVYTSAVFYLSFLLAGYYFLHKDKRLLSTFLISFLLLSIHPQYILQGRFVWNPSFVTPLVITSVFAFYLLIQKFTLKKLLVFSSSTALAISISYSVTPLLLCFFILWLIIDRQHFLKYFIFLIGSLIVLNLPTIFFEIRHNFLLTTSMFTKSPPTISDVVLQQRYYDLARFVFPTNSQNLSTFLLILSILTCLYLVIKHRKNTHSLVFISSTLYLLNALITMVFPFPIHSHYIFGFTSLIFLVISTLPTITSALIVFLFLYNYLQPAQLETYFQPAPRTYSQMVSCYTSYCHQFKEPTFVSVQSGILPFHNGPDHRYALSRSGCKILDIETQNGASKYMSVIVESSNFDTKTNYYELDLFGKHKEINRLNCQPNLEVVTLEKI